MKTKSTPWKMLMICLTTGIIINSLTSCKKIIDYGWETEWCFINASENDITATYAHGEYWSEKENFIISSGEKYSFKEQGMTRNPQETAGNFSSPYAHRGATIKIGDNSPVFYPGWESENFDGKLESICNRDNYSAEKLGTNKFRFTYIFK